MQPGNVAKDTWDAPARSSKNITPHDSNEVGEYEPKGLWISTGGTLTFRCVGDDADTVITVSDGTMLPARVRIVKATGTTASGLAIFW